MNSIEKTMVFQDQKIPVSIGPQSWEWLCEKTSFYSKIIVVSDSKVSTLYESQLSAVFSSKRLAWIRVPSGEEAKSLDVLKNVWVQLLELGADRRSCIIGFGGGVVGDLAGFAASTYMRGIDYFALPSTLLAMVDSCYGGKVGIDLEQGKNLVGAFWLPKAIAIQPEILASLPQREWSCAMAEVIKHAILDGPSHFTWLKSLTGKVQELGKEQWMSLIQRSSRVKLDLVREDPLEQGPRAWLNLGHSFGHAIESTLGYDVISHGEAIALGLLAALRLSRELGLLEEDFEEELMELLDRWGLPTSLPQDARWEDVEQKLRKDKKNRQGRLNFVLPRSLGRVEVFPVNDIETLKKIWSSLAPKKNGMA